MQPADEIRLSLARALIRRPQVLLLHLHGGSSRQERDRLVGVVRAFVRNDDPVQRELTTKHLRFVPSLGGARTAVWCSSGDALDGVLADGDRVITLVSPSRAEIASARRARE